MMFIRTQLGSQYLSYSQDGAESWSNPEPSGIQSPLSPATIKRIPQTGDLLMAWNDHSGVDPSLRSDEKNGGKRTPFTVAISRNDGRTWTHAHNILDDPDGWYCYTAMHFDGPRVLLGFNAGGHGLARLSRTSIAWFNLKDLYKSPAGR